MKLDDAFPMTPAQRDRHLSQSQGFGRLMAEQLFELNFGPATPRRPTAILVRHEELAAICAGAFALGRGIVKADDTEAAIPVGEATELPVDVVVAA